jgi:hypothetical protein
MTATPTSTFVIVGAGLAGAKAAETLRAEGFDGRLLLVGEEDERPYERPPLSKAYLRGEADRDSLYLHPEEFYADNDIELRPSTSVRSIHPAGHQLQLASGEQISYGRLLLATGARPRRLPLPGAELDGVHYLRTRKDADTLIGNPVKPGAERLEASTGSQGSPRLTRQHQSGKQPRTQLLAPLRMERGEIDKALRVPTDHRCLVARELREHAVQTIAQFGQLIGGQLEAWAITIKPDAKAHTHGQDRHLKVWFGHGHPQRTSRVGAQVAQQWPVQSHSMAASPQWRVLADHSTGVLDA